MKSKLTTLVRLHVVRLLSALLLAATLRADLPFVVISDWGTPPPKESGQREVAAQLGRTAAEIGSHCVITLGDNFHADGVQSPDDPLWKTLFEDVYTAPSLQTPWYPALGNHDYDGDPQAEIDYTKRSLRWRLHERYYTWTDAVDADTTVQFFILDSSPFVEEYAGDTKFARPGRARPDTAAQVAWFERQLAASKAKWKIVVAHHPVYSGGAKHGDTVELHKTIKPLLEKYGVQVVLSGHEHDFQHLNDGGRVHYFVISGGSVARPAGKHKFAKFMQGDTHGFGALIVKRNVIEVRFVDKTGKIFYKTEVR
ncbi:MAG: metallophosphoesterase [Opitutaceae bacterium]|jgi:acid phosphatase|nr:metallophosphoesterase [Opitutaceae bacterium]